MKLTTLISVCLCLTLGASAYAQQGMIKGVITDATTQEPLPGASVQLKGTTQGAVSDVNGKFSISAKTGDVLIVSFVGYLTQDVTVTDQTTLNVALAPDIKNLEEIVIVGYGTQKRTEVTGAITSVTSDKINAVPAAGLDQALQGRAAGVMVIANGGPGTAPTIRVRGIGTVNDANPLYVVDGVVVNGIGNISPSDIENVQVLKDASTAAVYGSRGSNGVIMVTTKKGKAGKTIVNFEAYAGQQYSNARYDVMNATQYREYATGAFPGSDAFTNPIYADRLAGIGPDRPQGGETDWQDAIFQKGNMQNYDLGISGGNENTSFRLSAGYNKQEGIIIRTGNERYSFRANGDFKKGIFKFGENLSLAYSYQNPMGNNGGRSLIEHAIKMAPYLPIYNHLNNGGFQGPSSPHDGQDAENPVRIMELNTRKVNTLNIIGNIYGEAEILKGLKFKTNLGLEDIRTNSNYFNPSFNDDNLGTNTHQQGYAAINKSFQQYTSFLFTNSFTYDVTLAEKHNIEALILSEYSSIHSKAASAGSQNGTTDEVSELTNESPSLFSIRSDYYRISYLGRLNYNYDEKYLFSVSYRKDASSRFGSNKRWGAFPSMSLGWNVAKESFMSDLSYISNLKLRGSWGKAGNDKIADYLYFNSITSNMYYVINNGAVSGSTPSHYMNKDLKWEETTMTNIGLDLGMFRNQFTLSAEYYKNKTDDLLFDVQLDPSLGDFRGSVGRNAASMETKGFELQLGYNDFEGAFQWSASLNLGTFKNEVKDLGGSQNLAGQGFEGDNLSRCEVGQPAFFFYGWKFDGIFQSDADARAYMGGSEYAMNSCSAGDFRIKDTDGNGVIDGSDKTNIGNPFPKMNLGFDLNASYKGFDLNLFISGVYGNDIYNTNLYDLEAMPRLFNASPKCLDRWTPENPSTTMPRAGAKASNAQGADIFVENGAYTKLKNITLGYTIPEKLLKNKLTKVRIYVSGQNLICLTDYSGLDPEIGNYNNSINNGPANGTGALIGAPQNFNANFGNGFDLGNYPTPKSVIAGIQVTF